jgi:O-succinylbenzoate synthase
LVEYWAGDLRGWGELSPYPGQDPDIATIVAAAGQGNIGTALAAAMDQARIDAAARRSEQTLAQIAGAVRTAVPMSIAIGAGPDAVSTVAKAVDAGITRFKLKVSPRQVTHVAEIRIRYPDAILGIDANGSFAGSSTGELSALGGIELAYVEEPCPADDARTLDAVRRAIDAPIFADESIRSVEDVENLARTRLVDGVVLKPGRLGFTGALRAAAAADAGGLRWRASGLIETSVGRAYTNALAALPSAFVSDVAPADWFLERDVTQVATEEGALVLPTGPGIGFDPDVAVIERYVVASHDLSHLLDRSANRETLSTGNDQPLDF